MNSVRSSRKGFDCTISLQHVFKLMGRDEQGKKKRKWERQKMTAELSSLSSRDGTLGVGIYCKHFHGLAQSYLEFKICGVRLALHATSKGNQTLECPFKFQLFCFQHSCLLMYLENSRRRCMCLGPCQPYGRPRCRLYWNQDLTILYGPLTWTAGS